MQQQFQETKAMLIKEREAAKETVEQVPFIKEVPVIDHEMMNKLAAENEKLKVRFNVRHSNAFFSTFWSSLYFIKFYGL